MSVLSVRLGQEELSHIKKLAKENNADQSQAARQLINEGWEFHLLCMYREGKISLGSLASELKIPLSSAIDFLGKIGVAAPLEYEDYLQGLDLLK
ncbi:MAG TPA: hypothetical protein ENH41_00665 [Candidatus Omnitrophica bacterium]|nr:hypothetical protein [Candidatus Omnitrophota bacterium]